MKQILFPLYEILVNRTPARIKSILKFLGIHKLNFLLMDKHTAELAFQRMWAVEFRNNKNQVLEYWEKYRYLNEIKTIVGICDGSKILDVGCGISTVLHFVKGKKYGIDPLAESYKEIYIYPEDICISKGEGENIPFTDTYFDIIFCSNVLDHVRDPQKTIDNILKVLRKDGFLVLTVEIFKEKIGRNAAHPHSLTKTNVVRFLGNRFKVVFEKESPWIGLRKYVIGKRSSLHNELILVLQKL